MNSGNNVDERTLYVKLPEDFRKFVEIFVSFERKLKETSASFCSLYDSKKGRNKDINQVQSEINVLKEILDDLEKDGGTLGQLFKKNLSFLMDATQIKETLTAEKELLNKENISLKWDLKNKQEEINKLFKQLEDHADISIKLTNKLRQLSSYVRLLESKCEDKDIEIEMNTSKYINSKGNLQELKKTSKSCLEKLTNENNSLAKANIMLEKRVKELENKLEEQKNHKDHTINEEILDEKFLSFWDESDVLRADNEKKHLTIERLKEEIGLLKKGPQLQIDFLTRENIMLQKLVNDQDLKIQKIEEEGHKKILFKEKAIQHGLLELHSKLSQSKKENILLKEDFHKKELENQKKIMELEESLRTKERNMELYEGYLKHAREIIGQLRTITSANIPL